MTVWIGKVLSSALCVDPWKNSWTNLWLRENLGSLPEVCSCWGLHHCEPWKPDSPRELVEMRLRTVCHQWPLGLREPPRLGATTYRLPCRSLCTWQCSHGRGSVRSLSPSSNQLCGYLHSQASGTWQPPVPLCCLPRDHICRARPSQSGPERKVSLLSERPRQASFTDFLLTSAHPHLTLLTAAAEPRLRKQ